MMMKNQKGITLILLALTVLIMIIILGTITYTSMDSFKMDQYYKMCADIELIDGKVSLYYLKHKDDEISNFGLPIDNNKVRASAELETIVTTEGNVNYNPNNCGELYKIDLAKLDNLTLNHDGDFYIDKQSHTVYYSQGYEVDGDVYYTIQKEYQVTEASNIVDELIEGFGEVNSAYIASFGKKVSGYTGYTAYNVNDEWRLFYADSDNAYLIKNSIGSMALNDSSMTGFGEDMTSIDYALGRALNPKYTAIGNWALKSDGKNINNNIKAVAALLDTRSTSRWNSYKTNDANWAIGAPTVEMFIASYNATHTATAIAAYKASKEEFAEESLTETQIDSIVESATSTGYKVKKTADSEFAYYTTDLGKSSTLDQAIYCNESYQWWLVSPNAHDKNREMLVSYFSSGALGNEYYGNSFGVRPLVCVPLSKIGTGAGKIEIGDF